MTPSRGTMKVPARRAASVAGGGHEARVVRILVLVDLSLFARSWARSRANAEWHHKWLSGVPWNADALIERVGAGRRSRTRRPEPGADWPGCTPGHGLPGPSGVTGPGVPGSAGSGVPDSGLRFIDAHASSNSASPSGGVDTRRGFPARRRPAVYRNGAGFSRHGPCQPARIQGSAGPRSSIRSGVRA